jgi:tRNA-specific 2-thiouridylase
LGEARFVSRIDPVENLIVLGRREDLETSVVPLGAVTFIAGEPPTGDRDGAFRARVRIRHRAPLVDATVRPAGDGSWTAATDAPVWAIAPGQACVLYDGNVCLGGGRIGSAVGGPPETATAVDPLPAGVLA